MGGFFILWRDAVGVFFSPSRLGPRIIGVQILEVDESVSEYFPQLDWWKYKKKVDNRYVDKS